MDAGPVSARGKVAGREAVAIHPHDAEKRGIKDGDVVRVYNSRGACLAGAVLVDSMLPGVAKLSCGAWYDPTGSEDGAVCVHGNANMLTHDRGTSKLSQGPSSGTIWSKSSAGRSRCRPYAPSSRRKSPEFRKVGLHGLR
jgi:biotin/methionine sulfoxide reductase